MTTADPITADEAALLAAIRATPDDDVPRLVFADWLDDKAGLTKCDWCRGSGEDRRPSIIRQARDGTAYRYVGNVGPCPKCKGAGGTPNGLAERAAFIRLQCEYGRGGSSFTARYAVRIAPDGPIGPVHRMACLLARHGRDWLADDLHRFGSESVCEWGWERGFPTYVTCPAADWLAHGDAILARHPVREVTLTAPPTDADRYTLWAGTHRRHYRPAAAASALTERWPGVRFTLPPGP